MGNCIPRKARYIVARALTDSSALKAGDIVGLYKDVQGWHMVHDNNIYLVFTSQLRNPNYFEFISVC